MKKVEIFEGERASNYDISIKTWCPEYDFIQALIPALLFQYLDKKQEKNVLIAGCGTGAEMEVILKASPLWSITGFDPSIEMTTIAINKLRAYDLTAKYKIINKTIANSPLTKYSASTLVLVLHFLPDDGEKLQLLKDISARMEPSAPLIIVDIFGQKEAFLYNLSLLRSYLIEKGIEVSIVEQGINHIQNDLYYIPEERLFELLGLAGFRRTQRFHQSLIFGGWITEKI